MSLATVQTHPKLTSSSVITVQSSQDKLSDSIHISSPSPAETALLTAGAFKGLSGRDTGEGKGLNEGRRKKRDPVSGAIAHSPSAPHAAHLPEDQTRFRPPSANSRLGEYLPGKVDATKRKPASVTSPRTRPPSAGTDGLRSPNRDTSHVAGRTGGSPHIRTPMTPVATTPHSVRRSDDYFSLGITVSKDGSRTPRGEDTIVLSPLHPRGNNGMPESPGAQRRMSRPRDRKEKDKKTMLSKALEKANTAVLLDNAQNFAGALDAYTDACNLLEQVMDRTAAGEDRVKLEAIRSTYAARIHELDALQHASVGHSAEKQLPPRPPSEDYAQQPPRPQEVPLESSPSELPASPVRAPHRTTRDSFLTDVIREVEGGSRSSGFLGPLWERSKGPQGTGVDQARSREDLTSLDAPQPLATSRSQSPQPPPKDIAPAETAEPASWLNTIDESDLDEHASAHAGHGDLLRRRNLGNTSAKPATEFDMAFDEAVEAAYEDGYELDQGDDEQQMMDDIAKDFMDQGFAFSEKNKSSLPRHSLTMIESRDAQKPAAVVAGQDRAIASASLSTLDEDYGSVLPRLTQQHSSTSASQTSGETTLIQTATDPMSASTEALQERRNRFSSSSLRPLTIDSRTRSRKRAPSTSSRKTQNSQHNLEVTPWEAVDTKAEVTPWEVQPMQKDEVTPWESQPGPSSVIPIRGNSARKHDKDVHRSIASSDSSVLGDMSSPKARYLRNQKSSTSLRDTLYNPSTPAQSDFPTPTPTSATFSQMYSRRNESSSRLSQRSMTVTSATAPGMPPLPDVGQQGGMYLFDTTLGRSMDIHPTSSSPKAAKDNTPPAPFEPCPDSPLLRPFWLLRSICNTVTHPRGAYLTTRLFMPREAWLNKSVKLKNVEDKIAACDLLTAALGPLNDVDSKKPEAVLRELQSFEEVMERVQQILIKKLGSEVGASHAGSAFKDADRGVADNVVDGAGAAKEGKNKFSWRKLRGRSSMPGTPAIPGVAVGKSGTISEHVNMQTVPMTSFNGVEKQSPLQKQVVLGASYEGPHKDYMAALAKLCEAAQAIDRVARQVEDPSLKASSTTLIGLEFSTRHAAEFFGFYVCRFMLSDIGTLIDKHVKRGTEWVLA